MLPARDCRLLVTLLRDVEADYKKRNAAPVAPRVRELIEFLRTAALSRDLAVTGVRSAAPVDGPTLTKMELMTANEISALAATRGVSVTPSHVRKCLTPVDQIGQANRYLATDAQAFVEERDQGDHR